jgi:hypothetical protein
MPWLPATYRGRFEGSALITTASGAIVAQRGPEDGEGIVLGEITPGRRDVTLDTPAGFWLHRRGALPSAAWHYQRWHGRRWYQRNVVSAPAAR